MSNQLTFYLIFKCLTVILILKFGSQWGCSIESSPLENVLKTLAKVLGNNANWAKLIVKIYTCYHDLYRETEKFMETILGITPEFSEITSK